jgi:beta-aspartyl-peptidase (threonine type)
MQEVGKWVIAIHGGAGDVIDPELHPQMETVLRESIAAAKAEIDRGSNARQVAVAAVVELERCEFFDAGYGGFPRLDGRVQLDVALVDGSGRFAALAGIDRMIHPSRFALSLFERSEKSFFRWYDDGIKAQYADLLRDNRDYYRIVDSNDEMVAPFALRVLDHVKAKKLKHDHGTVGCVVRDPSGKVVAVTSTGGTPHAPFGRIGDSPVVGCGAFADSEIAALSATGPGESFLACSTTAFAAFRLGAEKSSSVKTILHEELERMRRRLTGSYGGLIAVTADGRAATCCTTEMMPAGIARLGGPGDEIFVSVLGNLELC